jgi:Ca2+-binding EF-hand superfamily protein
MSRVVRNVTGEPYRLHIRRECVLKCSPSSKPPDGVRGAGVIQIVEMGPAWYFRFVNVNPHLPNVAGGVPPEVWVHTTVGRPRARMSKLRAGSHVGQRLTLEKGWRGRFRGRDVEGKRAPRGGDEPNPHAKAGTIFLEPIGADVEAEMRAMKGMAIFKEPDTAPFTVDPVIYAYGVFKPYLLGRVKIRAMEEEQARKAAAMLHIEMMYRDMYGSTDLDSTAWAAGAPPPPITALYERAQMKPEDVARYAYTRLKMRARETADFETFGRLLQAIDIYRTQAKMRILFEVGDLDHTGDVDFTEFSFIVRVLSRVPAPMPPTQLWETFQQFDGGHAALTAIELWEALRMEGIAITPKAAEKAMLAQLAREAARRQRLELQRNADIAATVAAEEKRAAERELARQKAAGEFDAPTCAEKLDSLIPRPQSAAQKAIAIASGATNGVVGVAGGSEETKAADREAAAGGVAQTGMAPDYNSLGYAGFREVWANVVASAGGKTLLEELEKRKLKKSRSRSKNAEALLNAVVTQDDKEDERFYAAKLAALEDRRVQRLSREMGPSALADVTSKEGKATRKAEAVADRRRQHLAQREAQRRRRQIKEEETLEAKMMREAELREQLVKDGERRRRKIEVEREEKRRAELGEHMIDWSGRGIAILPKELFLGAHNQERLGDVLTLDMSKNGLRMIPAFGALYWFNSLKKLDVSHNMLRELPGEVDSLTELVLMNASHNQLKSLPSQIGACHELKALDLSHNLLTELPEGVSEMHGLTYLNISSNKLVKLPKTMGNLTALRRLDASSNALGTELGAFAHLFFFLLAFTPYMT